MASLKQLLLASTAGLLLVGGAQAADLPTQKTPPAPPSAAASPCSPLLNNASQMHSPIDFFNTPGALTCYGITLYGTVDEGMGYESHGAPWNSQMYTADEELIQKNSYKPMFNYTPNGLSQSVVGIRGQEPIPGIGGTSLVFDAETGFDPGSFRLGNALGSQIDNNGVPLNQQNANADGARAGQIFNSQVYVGLSNTTFGTLTWGRQNTLDLDGINTYDPMGGSYAFSVIGYSGATAGAGNTEDTRSNSALKYRVNYGQFRAAAMVQTGGFEQGNGAQGLYEAQVGGDFGGLSVDAIYSHLTDAVSAAAYVPAIGGTLSATQLAAVNAQQLTATLSDNDAVTLLAKYTWGAWKFYGGYEHIDFDNPTNDFSMFRGIGGYTFSNVTNNAYGSTTANSKVLQIMWTGAKYAITPNLDVTGAYYHLVQNSYYIPAGANNCNSQSAHSQCAGAEDAVSAMVDWRFWKHVDTYAGVMFSEVNGGLANGYLAHTEWAPSAGLRVQF